MRKYGKWLLVLSVLAVSPAVASADGFLGGRLRPSLPFAGNNEKAHNQALANEVAGALKEARLNGYDVEIEVRDGVATLEGNVRDATHRALATRVAGSIAGIQRVENNLRYVPPGGEVQQASVEQADRRVTQAAVFSGADEHVQRVEQVTNRVPAGMDNQQVANQIAGALGQAGFVGYDIEVRYNNGVATLGGNVGTLEQRQAASAIVSQIPGITSVENMLQVNPVQQTAFNAPMIPGPMPQAQFAPAGFAGQPGFAPAAIGAAPVSFTNPHLPNHAWPAYAQYPNSAAVTYPTQYSASAWPYIGPFYPYPQVPMGWREVSLEWDDGYWQLNFNEKKKEWYWMVNPKNW
ncbi:MAG: BON domain-containing protein [Planctomycetaceae bacterium]|nr:BON domain-containing protein [Planctomycetaceae bacterium]